MNIDDPDYIKKLWMEAIALRVDEMVSGHPEIDSDSRALLVDAVIAGLHAHPRRIALCRRRVLRDQVLAQPGPVGPPLSRPLNRRLHAHPARHQLCCGLDHHVRGPRPPHVPTFRSTRDPLPFPAGGGVRDFVERILAL